MSARDAETEAYAGVDRVLRLLTAGLDDVLGDQLVALYLTGSLSYGGFDPGSSDIDLLALLERPITSDQRNSLRTLHEQIASEAP